MWISQKTPLFSTRLMSHTGLFQPFWRQLSCKENTHFMVWECRIRMAHHQEFHKFSSSFFRQFSFPIRKLTLTTKSWEVGHTATANENFVSYPSPFGFFSPNASDTRVSFVSEFCWKMCTTFGCDRARKEGGPAAAQPQTFHFLPQLANLPQQLCIARRTLPSPIERQN